MPSDIILIGLKLLVIRIWIDRAIRMGLADRKQTKKKTHDNSFDSVLMH